MTKIADRPQATTIEIEIDQALGAYPLQNPPPSLAAGVTARLQQLPPGARPRFRLSWIDWAVSLFTTGMAGLGYVLLQSLPPQASAQLQVTWMIWLQHIIQFMPH